MTNLEREDIENIAELPYQWEKLNDKVIMISGGTGFIGSFIIDVLRYRNKKHSANIKVVSLSRHGGISDETVENIRVDISKDIVYNGKIDYILHLASNTHPKQYSEDPVGTITTNILGCNNLLRLAVEKKVSRFLLASSVEIYGQGTNIPMDEKYSGYIDCNDVRAGYNEAKRTCEALCQSYRQQYGVDFVILRLARCFGADRKKDTKAMAQFIDRAVAGENIVLKSKGTQKYSYCYVPDSASAIIKVLLDGTGGEAYNVAEEYENITLGGYAELIANIVGKSVVYSNTHNSCASKASYALLDNSKIKEIGWKPVYTVSEGIKRTLQIYKERNRNC